MLVVKTNALGTSSFLGKICFRRIFRRRISALSSSACIRFLENERYIAVMEGQPWDSTSTPSFVASKEMKMPRHEKQQHTGIDKPFRNSDSCSIDICRSRYPHRNDEMSRIVLSPEKNYSLRIRGLTTPSSGGAGIGLILEDTSTNLKVWSARLYVSGDRTPFEAEYSAIIMGVDYVCNVLKARRLTVLSANQIIVNQIKGVFSVSKSSLQLFVKTIKNMQRQLKYFSVEQIPSDENSEATTQAMKALATRKSLNLKDEDWKVERKDPIQKLKRNPLKMGRWRKPDDPAQSAIIDPSRIYRLQFDGGAREYVGAGMVLYDDERKEIWCGWHFHPEAATNNVAEYMGLICGLRCSLSLGIRKLVVEGDSLLVVQQMNYNYKTRERGLDIFRKEAHDLAAALSEFKISYIPRAENKRADWLANHAMNLQESDGFVQF